MSKAKRKRGLGLQAQWARTDPATADCEVQEVIELFTGLAAAGAISAETLAKIQAGKNKKTFDGYAKTFKGYAFECCTPEDLRRTFALAKQQRQAT